MTNRLTLLGAALSEPRSHEVTRSMRTATQLDHPMSAAGTAVYSMAAGQLYQIKLVAYLFSFVYFFRKFSGWLVVADFPPAKDHSDEVNTNDSSNYPAN